MPTGKNKRLSGEPVVIAVEGLDYLHLLRSQTRFLWPVSQVLLWDFQEETPTVPDRVGIAYEDSFELLVNERKFGEVRAFGIIRDAESDRAARQKSISTLLEKRGLPVPEAQMTIAAGQPAVGFLIMPHDRSTGCLEHACLDAPGQAAPHMSCANSHFSCVSTFLKLPVRENLEAKIKVHALIAGHHSSPAMTLGQSAGAGMWDFTHPSLKVMLDFIQLMRKAAGL